MSGTASVGREARGLGPSECLYGLYCLGSTPHSRAPSGSSDLIEQQGRPEQTRPKPS
jgi:hypothetical protein